MTYRLDPSRDLGEEVRRIATAQLERAAKALVAADRDANEAVHDARKRFKKVRGLYRLVRAAAPGFYRRENVRVGALARSLSGVRDASALVETMDDLLDHLSPGIAPDGLSSARSHLAERRDRLVAAETDLRERMRAAAGGCGEALRALDGLDLEAAGSRGRADAVAAGWRKVCKQGRRALHAAADAGDDAAFHDLRKRVKYHWMHVRLVEPAWPALMRLRRKEAAAIGDLIGDERNLSLLAALVEGEPEAIGSGADRDLLLRLVTDRRAALRDEAMGRAGRLFRDAPKQEAKRLARLWRQAA